MSIEQEFESAQQRVQKLPSRPSNDSLLRLYGLFKQGREGDVQGKRPGMLDVKGRAKYDAWAANRGMSAEQAMRRYVELVDQLESDGAPSVS